MGIVERDEIDRLTGVKGASNALMNLLQLSKLNRLYDQHREEDSLTFIQAILDTLEVDFDCFEEELKRIPKEGAFITVSNHPFGALDGIILLKLILERRPDFKVMANFLLERVEPIKDKIIPVNPFENHKEASSSFTGLKQTMKHLEAGSPVGFFPAGEVSSIRLGKGGITDREWQSSTVKLIKKAGVPIVPVYFHGNNSVLFYLLGLIHPTLRTAQIPAEILKRKNKKIKVRIGRPISVEEQNAFTDTKRFGRFIRQKTYFLGKPLKVNPFYRLKTRRAKQVEEIIPAVSPELIQSEIDAVRESSFILKHRELELHLAEADRIPNILQEIGRLREITFREVGEGTNKSIDIDEYDLYYRHLFLWDTHAKKIVGAYRLGFGGDIISQYGKRGMYFTTLFKTDKKVSRLLPKTIELGRAFITRDYQSKPFPLFLLWKGLSYVVLTHEKYRYFMGCVSISNSFSKFSKKVIIEFVKQNYYDHELANGVKPRKAYRVALSRSNKQILSELSKSDLQSVDKFIEEYEPGGMRMPVLLKKYVKQNARIIGFNVDPKFNNALDGLMIMDLLELPIQTLMQVIDDLGDDTLIEQFFQRVKEEKGDKASS